MKNWVRAGSVIIAALLLTVSEMAAAQPHAKEEGNVITDPRLGYRGTRIKVPTDYRRHVPATPPAPAHTADFVLSGAEDLGRNISGINLVHQFAFATEDNRAISVAVFDATEIFPPPDTLGWEREMALMLLGAAAGDSSVDLKTYRKAGKYHAGHLGWTLPGGHYVSVLIAVVPPGRILMVFGVANASSRDTIIRDIGAIADSVSSLK